jgi:hypothetical protein
MTILHVEFSDSHKILAGSIEKKDDSGHHKCVYEDAVINKEVQETTSLSTQYNSPEMLVAKEWLLQHKKVLANLSWDVRNNSLSMVLWCFSPHPPQTIFHQISHCKNSFSFHG